MTDLYPGPSEDSPQERDAKAQVLAASDRRFRWEMRFYMFLFMAYIIAEKT